ncbi:putative disease resistance protein [Salvia divinorum]|uniref:Disease resistance protein n=1 Tax=Salvia divinorum TaxID=28513 RepID=A0ABD1HFV1_SALDI
MSDNEQTQPNSSDEPKVGKMSDSGQAQQNASDGLKMGEFVDALKKKDGDEGLRDAFRVLCPREDGQCTLEHVYLKCAVDTRAHVQISDERAREIIQQFNKQGSFSCEDFVYIVKVIVAVKKYGLEKTFEILSKDGAVGVEDVQLAAIIQDAKHQNAKETILQVNKPDSFNIKEFHHIFKLLEEPGEADQTKTIHEKLQEMENHETMILYGKAGVGKTWMAREVANLAVRKRDFDAAIWVYLTRINSDDGMGLRESIAYQLSVLSDYEDAKAEKTAKAEEAKKRANAEETEEKEPEGKKKDVAEVSNAAMIKKGESAEEVENIEKLIVKNLKDKKILFVLDGEGNGSSRMRGNVVKDAMDDAGKQNFALTLSDGEKVVVKMKLGALETYKVMKTKRRDDKLETAANMVMVMVKPFSWERSMALAARAMAMEGVEGEEVGDLARYFMFRSERLPSQLLLITRIVSYLGSKGKSELQKLRDDRATIKKEEKDVMLLSVLIKRYEERLPKSVLIDCYGPDTSESHFMRQGRPVNFNELICYWIMEGHLGPFDRVHEAYHKGHRVFMELMDCGLLQKQEADYIAPSGATTFTFHISDYEEFFSGVRPGIGVTFDMSLGRVALGDGMIRTISNTNTSLSKQVIPALLLYGNRIGEEEFPMESLSEHKEQVEILAISDPTSQHFKLPILEMEKLRLLAIRGCQFLDSLEPFLVKKPDKKHNEDDGDSPQKSDTKNNKPPQESVSKNLEGLTVLEISGPNSQIKAIPDMLFTLMPNLKTVNLSHLAQVKTLPTSFYSLTQIEFLILRGCESLQELGTLKVFKDLKILDVSGSTLFEKFEDKSLHTNTKLQILNLSKTNLKTLPLINQLKELKFVWLKDCPNLPRIRKLDKMLKLEIFDISGAAEVERFCDPSLEDLTNLVTINISNTKIRRLPANLGDPTYLYARNCLRIRVVPPVEGLKKLQVLDLSGCIHLREVRKEFFTGVKLLRSLNLSGTNVRELPFIDGDRSSLRVLVLSGCKLLEKVGSLRCLKDLELLDLSGCEKVMELEEGSFDEMKHLEHLNLSGTGVGKPMPSLSKLENLKELHVRDCPNLTELPGVEQVPNLQLLDCSGTVLETPPCFSEDHPPPSCLVLVGGGVESIDTVELLRKLGAEQGGVEGKEMFFKQDEVSQCNWNMRIGSAETPIYGVHFLRLWKDNPSFLTQNLSKFCILVYPSEVEVKMQGRFREESYADEVSLREIYFKQLCGEKMKKCLEIREFKKLPQSLDPLIAQAQLVVLVDVPFLVSLLDLRSMHMKACCIERCSEFKYVFAAPEKKEEEGKGEEGQQSKNGKPMELEKGGEAGSGESAKGQGNEAGAHNLGESEKGQGDQQKNEKSGDEKNATKSGDDEKKNVADAEGKSEKIGGNQPENENAYADNSRGDQQKNEKSGDEKNVATENTTKSGDDEKKNVADAEGKSEKIGGNQPENENAAANKSGGDQQKNEKSGDENNATKSGDDEKKNVADAEGKSEKIGGNQPENENAAADKSGGDQQKNEKSGEEKNATKSGDDEKKNVADAEGKSEKIGGNQPENENVSADNSKDKGDQQKNEKSGDEKKNNDADAEGKLGDAAKKQGDEKKNAAGDEGGNQKNESDPAKNPAEGLKTLWISDVSNMERICKGDIKSVSFKLLKSLYLEYCPNLSEICSSSLQLETLQTLFIKYCHKLVRLFADENPSKMEKLSHLQLWGLDKLKKINCQTPSLEKLRVGECPELEHVIAESTVTGQQAENECHDKLKTLHIKSCEKLKSIFEGDLYAILDSLQELELHGLPSLGKVAMQATRLRVLRVGDCPSLTTVGANGARDLDTLEVKTCEKLTTITGGAGFNSKNIKLLGLPQLEKVEPKLPRNVSAVIWACPKLEHS